MEGFPDFRNGNESRLDPGAGPALLAGTRSDTAIPRFDARARDKKNSFATVDFHSVPSSDKQERQVDAAPKYHNSRHNWQLQIPKREDKYDGNEAYS